MSSNQQKRASWRVGVFGVLISAFFVMLASRKLHFAEVVSTLGQADLWPWLPLAVACYLSGHWIRGIRCRDLVGREATLSIITATNIVVLGYAVNNVLPARLGEFARADLLRERAGVPFTQALTVTLLERVLDGFAILGIFVVASLVAAPPGFYGDHLALLAGGILGLVGAGLVLILLFPLFLARFASALAARIRPGWRDRVFWLVMHVSRGLAYVKSPRALLHIGGLSVAIWLIEAGMFFLMLPAFGIEPRFDHAVLVMAVTNLGILVPSSAGYIGPFHYFCAQALISLGAGRLVATSYAVAVHLVFYVPITLWGVGILFRYGLEISRMWTLSRWSGTATQVAQIDGVTVEILGSHERRQRTGHQPLVGAIALACLPPKAIELGSSERDQLVDFVAGQLASLSTRNRLLLWVALVGFDVLSRLRHGRGYVNLDAETRRHIIEGWGTAAVPLMRQFVRLFRSCALLSYYELPSVRYRLAGTRARTDAPEASGRRSHGSESAPLVEPVA